MPEQCIFRARLSYIVIKYGVLGGGDGVDRCASIRISTLLDVSIETLRFRQLTRHDLTARRMTRGPRIDVRIVFL